MFRFVRKTAAFFVCFLVDNCGFFFNQQRSGRSSGNGSTRRRLQRLGELGNREQHWHNQRHDRKLDIRGKLDIFFCSVSFILWFTKRFISRNIPWGARWPKNGLNFWSCSEKTSFTVTALNEWSRWQVLTKETSYSILLIKQKYKSKWQLFKWSLLQIVRLSLL